MAGFLYFVSGDLVHPTPEQLLELGLVSDRPLTPRAATNGPDGRPGCTVADPTRISRIGYFPDDQEWHPVERLDAPPILWIGWPKGQKPVPSDLERPQPLPGVSMQFGDGNEWTVPLVQEWNEGARCKLPAAAKRFAGEWVIGDVREEYRKIWATAQAYWQTMLDASESVKDGFFRYEFDGILDYAADLLSLNYVIGREEIGVLELFGNDGIAARICEAAIDWPTFTGWYEKKSAEYAGESTSPGDEELSPTGDPPAPTTKR